MNLMALAGYWFLAVWPGLAEDQLFVVEWPVAATHRESHVQMNECWAMRDLAEADGKIATCAKSDHKKNKFFAKMHGAYGQMMMYPGKDKFSVSPHPWKDGDKIRVWKYVQ